MDAPQPLSAATPRASADGARERDFYMFYEPFHRGIQHDRSDHPRTSFDKALACFAQLGALRLNARRVLISFFDRNNEYLLAEATRSVSLQTHEAAASADALWVGSQAIKRPATLCEHTMATCYQDREDAPLLVDIISDVDEQRASSAAPYSHLPPDLRFYAGAPISTPAGYVIGTYSIMDDVERDGLTEEESGFMTYMAAAVMEHIDSVRAREEHRRAAQMVSGLGSFVEGHATLQDWYEFDTKDVDEQNNESAGKKGPLALHAPTQDDSAAGQRTGDQSRSQDESGDPPRSPTEGLDMLGSAQEDSGPSRKRSSSAHSASLPSNPLNTRIKNTFGRAANIILKSIDVHGAVFFDAAVSTFGGMVNDVKAPPPALNKAQMRVSEAESGTSGTSGTSEAASDAEPDLLGKRSRRQDTTTKCSALGYATSAGSSLDTRSPPLHFSMTEAFLRSLLRQYPRGKILNFDPGDQSPHATQSDGSHHSEDFAEQIYPAEPPSRNPRKREKRAMRLQRDLRQLRHIFPGIRSLAFIPLWDGHNQRWYACGIAWSNSPMRLLHQDSELSFMAAFGQTIMTEIARLDTAMSDKIKGDLLGSISHELRSPLHGILGSIELLENAGMDNFQESIIRTTETCGRTLLDTIDHLLDYAKINNFGKSASSKSGPAARRYLAGRSRSDSKSTDGMMNLDVDVDISAITEEAMESVVAGFAYAEKARDAGGNRSSTGLDGANREGETKKDVIVILDVGRDTDPPSWSMRTQAGAWRRIVMNICGNALKYCDSGYVRLKLDVQRLEPVEDQEDPNSGATRSLVTLTVIDSGKGMSQSYLQNCLFKPFAQEDPLQPGTGLGLSIVQQIVSGLGGEIFVDSATGLGTEIQVQVTMTDAPTSSASETMLAINKLRGREVAFLAAEGDANIDPTKEDSTSRCGEKAAQLFFASLYNTLECWFGMKMRIVASFEEAENSDVVVMHEAMFTKLGRDISRDAPNGDAILRRFRACPTLVICTTASKARDINADNASNQHGYTIDAMVQPIGPQKLAHALVVSLESQKLRQDLDVGGQDDLATPEPAQETETILEQLKTLARRPKAIRSEQLSQDRDLSANSNEQTQAHAGSEKTVAVAQDQRGEADATQGAEKRQPLHALLVDDNRINLQLLERFLRGKKHTYATAGDGVQAVEAYTRHAEKAAPGNGGRFDVVLMDINMPRMDGLEATRRIRAYERRNGLESATIVALTGLASADSQQEAYSSGVDLFLTKPVRLKELDQVLKGLQTPAG